VKINAVALSTCHQKNLYPSPSRRFENRDYGSEWIRRLDPRCFSPRVKGYFNFKETNACFAGDGIILKFFRAVGNDPYVAASEFAATMAKTMVETPKGGVFDFDQVYSDKLDWQILTLLAAVGSSGNSGNVGWLKGLEDRLLRIDLATLDFDSIYLNFKMLQQAKINYQLARQISDQNHIRLKLNGVFIDDWVRHNVMAAFLGCVAYSGFDQWLIYGTGIGYESRDFMSHIEKENWTTKAAIQNFIQDTNRYRISSKVGYRYCHSPR
jgi:hypothetical protein